MDGDVARLRLTVARLARSLRAGDAASGLTPTQSSLIATVDRKGPIGLSDLARCEGVNPTMLSRAVARLEEAGLFHRATDPDDRRAATVELTPGGRKLLRRLRDGRNDALRAQLAELSPAELRRLAAALPVLEQLADRLKAARP